MIVYSSKYCYQATMTTVRKVSIALPGDMVALARKAVDGGQYASVSEVVREALRDWKDKQDRKAIALKELKRMVREGLDSGPGKFASMDEIKAEARRRFEQGKSSGLPLEPSRNEIINGNAHEHISIDDKK